MSLEKRVSVLLDNWPKPEMGHQERWRVLPALAEIAMEAAHFARHQFNQRVGVKKRNYLFFPLDEAIEIFRRDLICYRLIEKNFYTDEAAVSLGAKSKKPAAFLYRELKKYGLTVMKIKYACKEFMSEELGQQLREEIVSETVKVIERSDVLDTITKKKVLGEVVPFAAIVVNAAAEEFEELADFELRVDSFGQYDLQEAVRAFEADYVLKLFEKYAKNERKVLDAAGISKRRCRAILAKNDYNPAEYLD